MKILAVSFVTLLLTVAPLMVSSVASENSNKKTVYGPRYNSWITLQEIDTFFGNEIYRGAYQANVSDVGSLPPQVTYSCENGSLLFRAFSRYDWTLDEMASIKKNDVFIKVDDGPIIETTTNIYASMVVDPDTVIKVRDLFRTGIEAKIRIVHDLETFTHTVDLEGFKSASEWVEHGCAEINL